MKTEALQDVLALFGEPVVHLGQVTDPATLNLSAALIDRVHDSADALLSLRGDPDVQRRYIGELPFDVRLLLAMRLLHTELVSKLIRAGVTRAL